MGIYYHNHFTMSNICSNLLLTHTNVRDIIKLQNKGGSNMKLLKDYKGVALIYLIITLFNIIWVINYEKPNDIKQVQNERNIVMNS